MESIFVLFVCLVSFLQVPFPLSTFTFHFHVPLPLSTFTFHFHCPLSLSTFTVYFHFPISLSIFHFQFFTFHVHFLSFGTSFPSLGQMFGLPIKFSEGGFLGPFSTTGPRIEIFLTDIICPRIEINFGFLRNLSQN